MATAASKSKSALYDEVMKCAEDPAYFITKYLFVQHPVKGRLPFQLFDFQKDCLNDFIKYKHNIIVKSRQLGLSETVSAYCLWLMLFHRDKNIVLMATTLKTSGIMVRKIREKFKMLPSWMTGILEVHEPESNSKFQLALSNGSVMKAVPATDGAVRGEAGSIVVVDEAAFIDNFKDIWKAIFPVLSTGGSSIIFSSPNGKNYFYDLYHDAERNKNGEQLPVIEGREGIHFDGTGINKFHAVKLPWTVHPERDDKWFEETSAGMDEKGIAQEFLCQFESSGTTYFGNSDIAWLNSNIIEPVAYSSPKGIGNDLWVWKTAMEGHEYLLTADVARGDADDFSAFHVIDKTTSEIVAEYMGKIPPDRFAEYLVNIGQQYNKAFIVFEKNTFGHQVGTKLRDLKYENVYYDEKIMEKILYAVNEDEEKDLKAHSGFTVTPKNREKIISNLEQVIRNKKIRIYSSRFIMQTETFVWTGKRAQAMKRKNDDLIMSLAIGLQLFDPKGDGAENAVDTEAMSWHNAFLASLKKTGVSKTKINNGISDYGSRNIPNSEFGNPTVNQNSPLDPVKSFGQTKNNNVYNGKKLPPGVKKENVAQDQMLRSMFNWLMK